MYQLLKLPEQSDAYFKLLFLTGFANLAFTGTALFLHGTFLIAFLALMLWFTPNNQKYMKNIFYCCFPLVLYLVLSIFSMPIALCKLIAIGLFVMYLMTVYFVSICDIFAKPKFNKLYVLIVIAAICGLSVLVRIINYSNTVQLAQFIERLQADFFSYLPVVFLMCISFTVMSQDKELTFAKKSFYLLFNGVYICLFLNPIASIFLAKYIVGVDVYWRLFYCTNFIYLLIYLVDRLLKNALESHLLKWGCIVLLGVTVFYFKTPISDSYHQVPLTDENFDFITKMKDVYWRLFYCTNFIYLLIYLVDQLLKNELESHLLKWGCIVLLGVTVLYFKTPISDSYHQVPLTDENFDFITKMNKEVLEISYDLNELGEVKAIVPYSFYREGVRGIASNLNLLVTVYDDRQSGKSSIDKRLLSNFLENGLHYTKEKTEEEIEAMMERNPVEFNYEQTIKELKDYGLNLAPVINYCKLMTGTDITDSNIGQSPITSGDSCVVQLAQGALSYGPFNPMIEIEDVLNVIKKYDIEYLVVKNTVNEIQQYPQYFEVIKTYESYSIIRVKGVEDVVVSN